MNIIQVASRAKLAQVDPYTRSLKVTAGQDAHFPGYCDGIKGYDCPGISQMIPNGNLQWRLDCVDNLLSFVEGARWFFHQRMERKNGRLGR